jgi:hypothetical protein
VEDQARPQDRYGKGRLILDSIQQCMYDGMRSAIGLGVIGLANHRVVKLGLVKNIISNVFISPLCFTSIYRILFVEQVIQKKRIE